MHIETAYPMQDGCNWWVSHSEEYVLLETETGYSVSVLFDEYKREVLSFVDAVEGFYKTSKPKNLPRDKYDRDAYIKFWKEWRNRRNRWNNVLLLKFNILKHTLIFSIVGLFIPGFTAIGLLGVQILLSNNGIECHVALKIIWTVTTVLGFILPILFYWHISRLNINRLQSLKLKLILFNLFEYVFIQSSMAALFTDEQTLCYVTDGQNGLELAFTGWLAIPFLMIFSFVFNHALKRVDLTRSLL